LVGQAVTSAKGNIVQIKYQDRLSDPVVLILDVEVEGKDLLDEISKQVKALPIVHKIERIRG
jgi:(p)ppGpp synthase/HD superfamily hydrolase